jgi:hypothetical protein
MAGPVRPCNSRFPDGNDRKKVKDQGQSRSFAALQEDVPRDGMAMTIVATGSASFFQDDSAQRNPQVSEARPG